MPKIIRQNKLNTVRAAQLRTALVWGGAAAVLLLAAGLSLWKGWWAAAGAVALAALITAHVGRKKAAVIRAGADGESRTLALLKKLPGSYTVLPDAVIAHRGHRSQTDYIIVAPRGVLILEAKNVSGLVTGRPGDREWRQKKRSGEEKTLYNPLMQVAGHRTTLERILDDAGIRVPVHTMVYFANPNAEVRIASGEIATIHDREPLDRRVYRTLESGEKIDSAAVVRAICASFAN